jgi:hypothetical protein
MFFHLLKRKNALQSASVGGAYVSSGRNE